MVKKIGLSIIVAGSLAFIGCGGSSSSSSTSVGTYTDEAIGGVQYVCGNQAGVTDEKGQFSYEIGQPCSFKLGGVTLRNVQADVLSNAGVEILETNANVAALLQALDADKDPSNGISITPAVVENVTADNITGDASDSDTITQIANTLGVTLDPAAAASHLLDRVKEVISSFSDGTLYLVKVSANGRESDGSASVDNILNELTVVDGVVVAQDEDGVYPYVGKTADYLIFDNKDGSYEYIFATQEAADAFVNGGSTADNNTDNNTDNDTDDNMTGSY
ncbi:MAG: hypothetical protein GXO40_02025 [Epsilonproteobacteria bacterium]|nr:hypothetical protein [Campylobacterota bacterium]